MSSDVRELIKALPADIHVEIGGKHYGLFRDGKRVGTLPMSPSDHRWRKNSVRQLIRAGVLTEDPFRNRTMRKERTMAKAGVKHQHATLTEDQQLAVLSLFEQIAKHYGLTARKGRSVAHGTIPTLTEIVYDYSLQENVTLPPVIRYGGLITGEEQVRFLCERLNDVALGATSVWHTTADFIKVAVDAWVWFGERGYTLTVKETPPVVEDTVTVTDEPDERIGTSTTDPYADAIVTWRNERVQNGKVEIGMRLLAMLLDPDEYTHDQKIEIAREVAGL